MVFVSVYVWADVVLMLFVLCVVCYVYGVCFVCVMLMVVCVFVCLCLCFGLCVFVFSFCVCLFVCLCLCFFLSVFCSFFPYFLPSFSLCRYVFRSFVCSCVFSFVLSLPACWLLAALLLTNKIAFYNCGVTSKMLHARLRPSDRLRVGSLRTSRHTLLQRRCSKV